MLCQKRLSRARTSNYIPQILWDVIICPCTWCLLLAPVPLRLFSNVMTLYWHNMNVSKMSILLKLRPTNGGDIVLTFYLGNRCIQTRFIGRDCFHTYCRCREQPFHILWRHRSESTSSHVECFILIFKQYRNISIAWKCPSMPFNKYTMHVLWLFCFIFTKS